MVSLAEFSASYAVRHVRRFRDTSFLIRHLRAGSVVTPEMAKVIADLLDGSLRAKPKKPFLTHAMKRNLAQVYVRFYRSLLEDLASDKSPTLEDEDKWAVLSDELCRAGYVGPPPDYVGPPPDYVGPPPETKGEITNVAKFLTAQILRLSPAQLDEWLRPKPRSQRGKSGNPTLKTSR